MVIRLLVYFKAFRCSFPRIESDAYVCSTNLFVFEKVNVLGGQHRKFWRFWKNGLGESLSIRRIILHTFFCFLYKTSKVKREKRIDVLENKNLEIDVFYKLFLAILFKIIFSLVLTCSFHSRFSLIITPRNLKCSTLSILNLLIEISGNFNGNESLLFGL